MQGTVNYSRAHVLLLLCAIALVCGAHVPGGQQASAGAASALGEATPQTPSGGTDLDKRVQAYLDAQRDQWGPHAFPDADGKLLFEMIVRNRYTRAVEIGTGGGHSAIWLAWALSKTGGKLITIEINETRLREAQVRFRDAGLSDFIDARPADALKLLPQLPGPFDFVFMDAPTALAIQFFNAAVPKLVVGGRYVSHGITGEPGEYVAFLKSLKTFETSFDTGGEFCVSVRKAPR